MGPAVIQDALCWARDAQNSKSLRTHEVSQICWLVLPFHASWHKALSRAVTSISRDSAFRPLLAMSHRPWAFCNIKPSWTNSIKPLSIQLLR